MSLEKLDDNYYDFDSKLTWLLKRMRRFHDEARKLSLQIDNLWDTFTNKNYPNEARTQAKTNYDKKLGQQQMYDRWIMRESAIIQAEIAAQEFRRRRLESLPHQIHRDEIEEALDDLPEHDGFSVGTPIAERAFRNSLTN